MSISSVAYATDDSASLANTASAVGLPSRSCISWSVRILRPNSMLTTSDRRDAAARARPSAAGVAAWSRSWSRRGAARSPGAETACGSRLGSVTVVAM